MLFIDRWDALYSNCALDQCTCSTISTLCSRKINNSHLTLLIFK